MSALPRWFRFGRGRWLVLLLFLLVLVGAFFAVQRSRYRFVQTPVDLLRLLPPADATVFFADLAALRSGGYLRILAGPQPAPDIDYTAFVRETGFDYTRDADALCCAVDDRQTFCAVRGRFRWSQLQHYVHSHGGTCQGSLCRVPGTTAARWISFRPVQPDVIAFSVSSSPAAALYVRLSSQPPLAPPDAPLWLRPSRALLSNPAALPLALRIFAISLQSSDSVLLSLKPSPARDAAFSIRVDAACPNPTTADTARNQMELNTKMLELALAREKRKPNPRDLTGLLTSGKFQVDHQHLLGTWLVPKELLETLR